MKVIIGKMVVLGQAAVGKTSVLQRYIQKSFNILQSATVGATFFNCSIKFENDITVKLQVWDTSGEERFKAMAPMFYRNANVALILFSIDSYDSFESMQQWVKELKRHVEEHIVMAVVGNKIDLEDKREVERDEAIQYANSIGATYYECSAKTDQGIETVFQNVAVAVARLAGSGDIGTLRIYEGEDSDNLSCSARELNTIVVGKVEDVNHSIDSVAFGSAVKSKCC